MVSGIAWGARFCLVLAILAIPQTGTARGGGQAGTRGKSSGRGNARGAERGAMQHPTRSASPATCLRPATRTEGAPGTLQHGAGPKQPEGTTGDAEPEGPVQLKEGPAQRPVLPPSTCRGESPSSGRSTSEGTPRDGGKRAARGDGGFSMDANLSVEAQLKRALARAEAAEGERDKLKIRKAAPPSHCSWFRSCAHECWGRRACFVRDFKCRAALGVGRWERALTARMLGAGGRRWLTISAILRSSSSEQRSCS